MQDPATFIAPLRYDAGEFQIGAYRLGDGGALAEAVNASYEHLRTWMPWAKPDETAELAELNVRRFIGRYFLNEDFTMGIFDGDRVIGGTGFHLRVGPPGSRNAEIGMWIHGDLAGTGLGTRVLRAILTWGFDEWGWERLVWRCATDNVPSRRVAEKAGMTLEGIARQDVSYQGKRFDTCVFSMLRSDQML
jgi:RimJ/RimL family protein N-acetyltransferase